MARQNVTGPKLEAMLRRVQALLRQADDSAATPAESIAFRNKAEALMMAYRIDEAMLVQKPGAGIAPMWGEFDICSMRSEYSSYYRSMVRYVLDHVGARGVADTFRTEDGSYWRCTYVGFESDIRLVDMMYTSCMLSFQQRLEPRYNSELSDQVNAYNMRKAGMEGWRIALAIWGQREDKDLYRARRLFKLESLERGEDPSELLGQGNSMRVFRESYAHGFVSELQDRLWRMRMSRGEGSSGLVLAGRKEAIDAAFYERYPQYAPAKPLPTGDTPEEDDEEGESGSGGGSRSYARGTYQDPRATCERCQKAKSGYCRVHSYLRPSTSYREVAVNRAGVERGRQAARSVDLGPSSGGRRLTS